MTADSLATDEYWSVSDRLEALNAELDSAGADMQVAKAEVIYKDDGFNLGVGTVIYANDRMRGVGAAWVKGDPRRGGRTGVTYAVGSNTGGMPIVRNVPTGFRYATPAEVAAQTAEALDGWRSRKCSSAPIDLVSVPAGTDPDRLDQFFRGLPPSANYQRPADIVQGLWQPASFFRAVAGGPAGDGILGVTLSFIFTSGGVPTDIDGNGLADLASSEIFYSQRFLWGKTGALGEIDFFSVMAHETGHSLGLGHFGKTFVTLKDALDGGGVALSEVKYAPLALMNALYITGRSEIRGNDNSAFCELWASPVK